MGRQNQDYLYLKYLIIKRQIFNANLILSVRIFFKNRILKQIAVYLTNFYIVMMYSIAELKTNIHGISFQKEFQFDC